MQTTLVTISEDYSFDSLTVIFLESLHTVKMTLHTDKATLNHLYVNQNRQLKTYRIDSVYSRVPVFSQQRLLCKCTFFNPF